MTLIALAVSLLLAAAGGGWAMPDAGEGALDKEVVRRVIREHHSHTWACYEKNLSADSVTDFRVALTFVVGPTGEVKSAQAKASISRPEVESCLVEEAKTWRFPKPVGGAATIRYPFIFKADED